MDKYTVVDADKGIYKETKTRDVEVTITHVRQMIQNRETEIVEINKVIDIWKAKEAAIMALPDFKELELDSE